MSPSCVSPSLAGIFAQHLPQNSPLWRGRWYKANASYKCTILPARPWGKGMASGFNAPTPDLKRFPHARAAGELCVKIVQNQVIAAREGRKLPPLDLDAAQVVVNAGNYLKVDESRWFEARTSVIRFVQASTDASVADAAKRKLGAKG